MFAGHFGIGFGLKKAAPRLSLGWLFLAVNLVDIAWAAFILLGIEHVRIDSGNTPVTPLDFYDYPITHSLLATVVWMLVAYAVFRLLPIGVSKKRNINALILSGAVGSHFVLDFVSHRPDLPLWSGSHVYLGLGLWQSATETAIVEMSILGIGFWLYMRSTTGLTKWGKIGPWLLVIPLAVIQFTSYFGPPPPSVTAIGIAGLLGQVLIVALAFWLDTARRV
jgi:hypothetical protein